MKKAKKLFQHIVVGPGEKAVSDMFDVRGTFSGLELSPLRHYSLNSDIDEISSPNLNRALRAKNTSNPYINRAVKHIDKLISTSTLTKPLVVYRGIGEMSNSAACRIIAAALDSGTYKDDAFQSTSFSLEHASKFALDKGDVSFLFEIHLMPGNHGFVLTTKNKAASYKNECEVLLPRGNSYKVLSVSACKCGEKTIVYARLGAPNEIQTTFLQSV